MALYIKDETVDALAQQYQKATGAASKTAAVRQALIRGLKDTQVRKPIKERLAALNDLADDIGPVDPEFNAKQFADEMWGDT